MEIHLVAMVIAQHEIPWARIWTRHISVTSCFQKMTKLGHVLGLDDNVQIVVRSRLRTEKSVNTPAPIDPDLDVFIQKLLVQFSNVVGSHQRRPHAVLSNHSNLGLKIIANGTQKK